MMLRGEFPHTSGQICVGASSGSSRAGFSDSQILNSQILRFSDSQILKLCGFAQEQFFGGQLFGRSVVVIVWSISCLLAGALLFVVIVFGFIV